MANDNQRNRDAERDLVNADVQLEQQGASPAERERIGYGALGEEGGEAAKEKYIDSWRDDDKNRNRGSDQGSSR